MGQGLQVLAARRPHRGSLRRSESRLHLPADGTLLHLIAVILPPLIAGRYSKHTMNSIDRRRFLVRSGLALSAALLAAEFPVPRTAAADEPSLPPDWQAVRDQFSLSRELIHLAGFFLASHPRTVREAIERHRAGLDADPIGYGKNRKKSKKRESFVPRPTI